MDKNEIKELANYCLNCKVKPCQKGCPLGNDIPEFIKNIKEENYKNAYRVLCNTTVLESVCGRICPHMSQCMGKCVRGIKSNCFIKSSRKIFTPSSLLNSTFIPKSSIF